MRKEPYQASDGRRLWNVRHVAVNRVMLVETFPDIPLGCEWYSRKSLLSEVMMLHSDVDMVDQYLELLRFWKDGGSNRLTKHLIPWQFHNVLVQRHWAQGGVLNWSLTVYHPSRALSNVIVRCDPLVSKFLRLETQYMDEARKQALAVYGHLVDPCPIYVRNLEDAWNQLTCRIGEAKNPGPEPIVMIIDIDGFGTPGYPNTQLQTDEKFGFVVREIGFSLLRGSEIVAGTVVFACNTELNCLTFKDVSQVAKMLAINPFREMSDPLLQACEWPKLLDNKAEWVLKQLVSMVASHPGGVRLCYKGGFEGGLLKGLFPQCNPVNLETLGCKKIDMSYCEDMCDCGTHTKRTAHCPLIECQLFAEWLIETGKRVGGPGFRTKLAKDQVDFDVLIGDDYGSLSDWLDGTYDPPEGEDETEEEEEEEVDGDDAIVSTPEQSVLVASGGVSVVPDPTQSELANPCVVPVVPSTTVSPPVVSTPSGVVSIVPSSKIIDVGTHIVDDNGMLLTFPPTLSVSYDNTIGSQFHAFSEVGIPLRKAFDLVDVAKGFAGPGPSVLQRYQSLTPMQVCILAARLAGTPIGLWRQGRKRMVPMLHEDAKAYAVVHNVDSQTVLTFYHLGEVLKPDIAEQTRSDTLSMHSTLHTVQSKGKQVVVETGGPSGSGPDVGEHEDPEPFADVDWSDDHSTTHVCDSVGSAIVPSMVEDVCVFQRFVPRGKQEDQEFERRYYDTPYVQVVDMDITRMRRMWFLTEMSRICSWFLKRHDGCVNIIDPDPQLSLPARAIVHYSKDGPLGQVEGCCDCEFCPHRDLPTLCFWDEHFRPLLMYRDRYTVVLKLANGMGGHFKTRTSHTNVEIGYLQKQDGSYDVGGLLEGVNVSLKLPRTLQQNFERYYCQADFTCCYVFSMIKSEACNMRFVSPPTNLLLSLGFPSSTTVYQPDDPSPLGGFMMATPLIRVERHTLVGPFLGFNWYHFDGRKPIVVSEQLLNEMRLFYVGRSRDMADRSLAFAKLRTLLRQNPLQYFIPPSMQADSLLLTEHLGRLGGVDLEVGLGLTSELDKEAALVQLRKIHKGDFSLSRWRKLQSWLFWWGTPCLSPPNSTCPNRMATGNHIIEQFNETHQSKPLDDEPMVCIFDTRVRTRAHVSALAVAALAEGAYIRQNEGDSRHKERWEGAELVGMGIAQMIPVVNAECCRNEIVALSHRVCGHFDIPWPHVWEGVEEFVFNNFDDVFPGIVGQAFEGIGLMAKARSAWLRGFSAPVQAKRLRCFEKLDRGEIDFTDKKYYQRQAFIKRELLPLSGPGTIKVKAPRVIQSTSDEFACCVGPTCHLLYDRLKRAWSLDNVMTIGSGRNAAELGSWMKICLDGGYDLFLENDFTSFDATVSAYALKFEHNIYRRFGIPEDTIKMFELQMNTIGYTALGTKYGVKGGRHSGDGNTTLGNTLIAALVMLYALSKCHVSTQYGSLNVAQFFDDVKILQGGDDNVTAMRRGSFVGNVREEVESTLKQLGFVPKLLLRENPENVTFFSSRFWPCTVNDQETFVLAQHPAKALAFLGWMKTPLDSASERQQWVKQVALGMRATARINPVVGAVVQRLLELTQDVVVGKRVKEMVEAQKLYSVTVGNEIVQPTEQTIAMFESVYGITHDEISAFRHFIGGIKTLPCLVQHAVLNKLIVVDQEPAECEGMTSGGENVVVPAELGHVSLSEPVIGREEVVHSRLADRIMRSGTSYVYNHWDIVTASLQSHSVRAYGPRLEAVVAEVC